MALRSFNAFKRTPATWSRNRRLLSKFVEERLAEEKHAEQSMSAWKSISLLIAVPTCLYLTWKNFFGGGDHEHEASEEDYVPYSHLRIRNKSFPWGDNSLIHNPHANFGGPAKEEEEEPVKERWTWYERLLLDYWLQDFDEDRRQMYRRQRVMQNRIKSYKMKKEEGHDPTLTAQTTNLFEEVKSREPSKFHSGINN